MKKQFRTFIIIFFWIALWQIASAAIRNPIIFVGPLETCQALIYQLLSGDFWLTVFSSFARISLGYLAAFLSAILIGSLCSKIHLLEELLEPVIVLLQSIPVASFVILALIWIGSRNLSVLITFLVVFPIIYRNVLEGIRQTDCLQLEMTRIFHFNLWQRICYLYRPSLLPYLRTGCKIALGMAWKSGIAAEVIGVPAHSIGEKLYMAKIYLSTGELFAWTFLIILISKLFERLFLRFLDFFTMDLKANTEKKCSPKMRNNSFIPALETPSSLPSGPAIHLKQIQKSYTDHSVLSDVSLTLEPGEIYCLLGPSGQGKTTLLRLLMGLEQPESGIILGNKDQRISAVFQEDRLFDFLSPVKNVALASNGFLSEKEIYTLLTNFLDQQALSLPVFQLSGGMKRRVAIARALASPSQFLIMDEPFAGLDETTRNAVIQLILKYRSNRTLLLVTHQEEDAEKLGAKIIRL